MATNEQPVGRICITAVAHKQLKALCDLDFRKQNQQVEWLIRKECEARGLDLNILEPVAAQPEAAAPAST